MPWLADTDVGAAHEFARALFGARTVTELRRRALAGLVELVPANALSGIAWSSPPASCDTRRFC